MDKNIATGLDKEIIKKTSPLIDSKGYWQSKLSKTNQCPCLFFIRLAHHKDVNVRLKSLK